MEIKFADTFAESLKKLSWHQSKIYKFYSFFRYDIMRFIKNVWRFRKPLANHYWWDHHGTLMFLEVGLTHMSENLEKKGLEIDISRLKKVAAMKRAVEIIKNYNESNYIEMAESELGKLPDWELEFEPCPDNPGYYQLIDNKTPEEKEHSKKVFERAREIEEQEWDELFEILKGKKYTDYDKHDGSGIKTWWD
jgi:hypothetical protein